MRMVYMDHSATTPVDPEVFEAMIPYLTEKIGNPSSAHGAGRAAYKGLETARVQVAKLINSLPEEIVFTSGGTEADNQAILGYVKANRSRGNHIITSGIEHPAVLDTCKYLAKNGFEVTFLPVDEKGTVKPEVLRAALKPETILVSIMHANNEIGTIQPLKELVAITHASGAAFHTDAVQTVGRIPVDVEDLGVDMLSVSSHKLYGPKGAGCLYIRKGVEIENRFYGGGQEYQRRAGTENIPGIIGLGRAAELAGARMQDLNTTLDRLTSHLTQALLQKIPDSRLTGDPVKRLPGHVSLCFKSVQGAVAAQLLDEKGIMVSSGSACMSGVAEPSHVLLALGLPPEFAHGSIRLTLGKDNTQADVESVIDVLPPVVARLRQEPSCSCNGCVQ